MVETPKQQIEYSAPGKPETTPAPFLEWILIIHVSKNYITGQDKGGWGVRAEKS